MIRNSGGAAEKKYKITIMDSTGAPSNTISAPAGAFVKFAVAMNVGSIMTVSGKEVPSRTPTNEESGGGNGIVMRAPPITINHVIVMPAEDVIVKDLYS